MRVKNIKVKTPSIPSRTAANQFLDREGYDMEFVPGEKLFYIHDTQKNQLHAIAMGEVTNFTLDVEPAEHLKRVRLANKDYDANGEPTKRGPGRPRAETTINEKETK